MKLFGLALSTVWSIFVCAKDRNLTDKATEHLFDCDVCLSLLTREQ